MTPYYKYYIVSLDSNQNLKYTYYKTQELLDSAKSEFDTFISSGKTEYIGSPGYLKPKIEGFNFENLSLDELFTIKNISKKLYKIARSKQMNEDTEFIKVWKAFLKKTSKTEDWYTDYQGDNFTKNMVYFDYKNPSKIEVKPKQEPKETRKSSRISNLNK